MEEASQALMLAVQHDTDKDYVRALDYYKKGIDHLLHAIKDRPETEKQALKTRVEKYLARAEEIRNITYKRHEQILITENSTGHSYRSIFGKYLDSRVKVVEIRDAYIREHFQIENFVQFLEVVVSGCKNVKTIELITGTQNTCEARQKAAFDEIRVSLKSFGVDFNYNFSSTLHDREIKFDNGWVVKIGRGLSYFKKPDSKYSLGAFDLNYRKCLETSIDIFHLENITSYS